MVAGTAGIRKSKRDMQTLKKEFTYIPNDILFAEVQAQIRKGKNVRLKVRGHSMLPLTRNNDEALLVPPTPQKIKKWMPVVARTEEMGIVLHRIVKIEGERITLLGDGNVGQFEHTTPEDIIAVVSHFYRGKRTLRTDTALMRLWSIMWYAVHPHRKRILKVAWNIKRIFKP